MEKTKKKEETLKSSVCLLVLSATKIEVGKWSLSKTKEILWTECSSHLLTFHEVPEVRLWPVSVNAEHLEDMLPELEIAERERLLAEERRREEEKKKKKMGEPEDMSIRLLKEVLDDLNVTYKASERNVTLLPKFAKPGKGCKKVILNKTHPVILHCIVTMTIRMTNRTGMTAAHSRPLCSR